MIGCNGLLLLLASGYKWRRLFLFVIPILVSALSSSLGLLLFGRGQSVIWQWGLVKISEESIAAAQLLGSKALVIGIISLILLLTTPPVLLFYSFMQQLKLPAKYMYSAMAAIRMIPMIIEEYHIRSRALRVRRVTFPRGLKGYLRRMQLYSVPLVAQSIRRAQRIAIAMEAKQFHLERARTYYYVTTYSKHDQIMLSYAVGILLLGWLCGSLVDGGG
jgi:energy-coupling factor transport system permease protein